MASVASALGGVRGAHRQIVLVSGAPGAGKSTLAAVEVYCACPLPVALERYAARQTSRHAAHAEARRPVSPEAWARWARPVGIGELVTVDTSAPVDVAAAAAEVRARLGASCRAGCG